MSIQDPAVAESASTLRRLIMGFRATQLVHVAAKLGLADLLQDDPQPPHQAQCWGPSRRPSTVCCARWSVSACSTETANGAFALTPMAQLLQTDATGSLRSLALLYGEQWLWQAYGRMLYSVETGRPAFEHTHGRFRTRAQAG